MTGHTGATFSLGVIPVTAPFVIVIVGEVINRVLVVFHVQQIGTVGVGTIVHVKRCRDIELSRKDAIVVLAWMGHHSSGSHRCQGLGLPRLPGWPRRHGVVGGCDWLQWGRK